MRILGIETSCDETSAAVVENGTNIISNIISSSQKIHVETGGIIPEIAAREQLRFIIPVINRALENSKPGLPKRNLFDYIDAIAVTSGPGLIGSLLIGVETAKMLAVLSGKPVIPVNHILAHLYANFLGKDKPQFPATGLVVSGGHTELFIMEAHERISWVGGTRDDAAGECFDKTARLLELGYPGGPAIAAAASQYQKSLPRRQAGKIKDQKSIKLPRPMMNSKDLNFSFSGLKTAVFREVDKLKTNMQLNRTAIGFLSYEIQESITDILVRKTLDAAQKYHSKSIIVGGGVAANKRLSEKMDLEIGNSELDIDLFIPPPSLCTDNAAYIAGFAFFHFKPIPWQEIQARPDLEVEVE